MLSIQFGFSQKTNNIKIYYDAIDLKNGKNEDNILGKYRVEASNVFLKDYFDKKTQRDTASIFKSIPKGYLINSIGNIEITPIADGLAQFIASRVKKELSIAFFDRFKGEISDYRDLQILFPNTYEQLQLIDTDIYDFQPYLGGLQKNAQTDFKIMPIKFSKLLEDDKTTLHKFTKSKPSLRYTLNQSFELINSFHEKKNIGVVLEMLNTSNSEYYVEKNNFPEIRQSIDILRLFSFALRDSVVNDSTYYINSNQIEEIVKDKILLKNFIGLAIAITKLGGVVKFDTTIYSRLNKSEYADNLKDFTYIIMGFKDANKYFESAKKEKADAKIGLYLQGVNQLFTTGQLISNKVGLKSDAVFSYLNKSMNLIGSLYQKKYSMAILQALDIYKSIGNDSLRKVNTKIYKYGTFLAQISELDKAEDVVKVLEHYAAPVGSYRDKSISKFTVSLDSFTGIGAGILNGDSTRFALSTPIGVSFSFSGGLGKWSWTVMPTLFDIGPLVSYRFLNSTGEVPSIHLKEIFAPGIFASVGFNSKCPIFLNVGYQKPAYLKTINATNATYNLQQYNFLTANIAVNIPLFRLFTN